MSAALVALRRGLAAPLFPPAAPSGDEIGRLETTEVTSRIHLQYSERYAGFLWPGLLLLLAEFILRQTRMRSLP